MQHGAVFGGIDLLAGEHRRDPLCEPAALRQTNEQSKGLGSGPLLCVIDVQAAGIDHHPLAAGGVGCK